VTHFLPAAASDEKNFVSARELNHAKEPVSSHQSPRHSKKGFSINSLAEPFRAFFSLAHRLQSPLNRRLRVIETGNDSTNTADHFQGERNQNQELKDAPQGQPGEEDVRDVDTS
jgi:hypothetical protein